MKWWHAILTSLNKTKLLYIYMKLFVDCTKEILASELGAQNTGKWWVSYFGLVFFYSVISKPGVTDSLTPGCAHQLQTEIVTKAALSFGSEEQEIGPVGQNVEFPVFICLFCFCSFSPELAGKCSCVCFTCLWVPRHRHSLRSAVCLWSLTVSGYEKVHKYLCKEIKTEYEAKGRRGYIKWSERRLVGYFNLWGNAYRRGKQGE